MKIATWNVNSMNVRLPHVLDWLRDRQPDILALQETKLTDPDFPTLDIAEAGYQAVFSGQKTYNGVAILSRLPASDLVTDLPGLDDPQRRVLGATIGDIRILNLYVPNGQAIGSDKYAYKLAWLDRLTAWLKTELAKYPRLVALGDFNIAPEDRDVYDPAAWRGRVLCSEPERAAFRRLLDLGLKDAFRLFPQEEHSFSWWDYRAAAFRRNMGLRIDHILVSPALAAICVACQVDKAPRRLERPSDHAPVIAEFTIDLN
ncbi:MAG: exodeoxyribonuclease III [Candidatus Contendobacter sp.]|nr:exodeoxyribonuclease III [Candidatus Contendobacter sp.]MDS4059245.1 exodeoxyribonuclease III [Candidatus Contendobacter sp.]